MAGAGLGVLGLALVLGHLEARTEDVPGALALGLPAAVADHRHAVLDCALVEDRPERAIPAVSLENAFVLEREQVGGLVGVQVEIDRLDPW